MERHGKAKSQENPAQIRAALGEDACATGGSEQQMRPRPPQTLASRTKKPFPVKKRLA